MMKTSWPQQLGAGFGGTSAIARPMKLAQAACLLIHPIFRHGATRLEIGSDLWATMLLPGFVIPL